MSAFGIHRFRKLANPEMPARLARVTALLDAGHTLRSAATEIGVSHETVRTLAKEAGLTLRPRGRPSRIASTPAS